MLITNTKTKTNLLGAGNKLSDNIVGYILYLIIYYLQQGGYDFIVTCLSVSRITQKVVQF